MVMNAPAKNPSINTSEFMRGSRDCEKGIRHEDGNSEAYDEGYAHQYQLEQIRGASNQNQQFN